MKRVAVVVQRCHESVVGGSEALAWQYAQLLAGRFEVEILTSTATDYLHWANALPAGARLRDGLAVRHFPVEIGRTENWHALNRLMARDAPGRASGHAGALWREALQDEYIRFQGPWCPGLHAWLRTHAPDMAAVLFCTYLYPTTYFGIAEVPPEKAILVPTLHDEPPAYLPVFAQRYASRRNRIWLTAAEQRVAARVWGFDGGCVLGMAVGHTTPASPERRERPYLLYCGRIDPGKGCDELLRAFARLRTRRDVTLVLTGIDAMGLPPSPDVEFLGFVDEAHKLSLMAGACGFVLPSPHESFSIVTLEAMAQRTPVVVNARCEVLHDHIARSGGGFAYSGEDDLVEAMDRVCTLPDEQRVRMGDAGRDYVLAHYREEAVRKRLVEYVEGVVDCAAGATA